MTNLSKAIRPLIAILLAACSVTAAAQRVSVKTNALYWAAATPNLGAEFRFNRHITIGLETAFNRFDISKVNTRMVGVMPEVRYWFSARPARQMRPPCTTTGTGAEWYLPRRRMPSSERVSSGKLHVRPISSERQMMMSP